MEWLAEEKRKYEDLQREKWRHVEEHMRITSGYYERMQGKSLTHSYPNYFIIYVKVGHRPRHRAAFSRERQKGYQGVSGISRIFLGGTIAVQ